MQLHIGPIAIVIVGLGCLFFAALNWAARQALRKAVANGGPFRNGGTIATARTKAQEATFGMRIAGALAVLAFIAAAAVW